MKADGGGKGEDSKRGLLDASDSEDDDDGNAIEMNSMPNGSDLVKMLNQKSGGNNSTGGGDDGEYEKALNSTKIKRRGFFCIPQRYTAFFNFKRRRSSGAIPTILSDKGIQLLYASGFLFVGAWWVLINVSGYSAKYYSSDELFWVGATPWYYFIPLLVSTAGLYLMQFVDTQDAETALRSERSNTSLIMMSLVMLFVGLVSSSWIFATKHYIHPYRYINGTILSELDVEIYQNETGNMFPKVYQGGGGGLLAACIAVFISALLSRWARISE